MRPPRANPLNRFFYRRILAGVVPSNFTIEKQIRSRFGEAVRLRTIHGGVDEAAFSPLGERAGVRAELGVPADAFLVGLLGRIGAVKGHGDFLEAARLTLARCPKAVFVILAKGSHPLAPENAEKLDSDPSLREKVKALGHRDDLPAVLRDFDLGVISSVGSEANCRVGLEWMASGVPLVATRVGVLPDIVEEGETGLLAPPHAPELLAGAISVLASQPDPARRMGEAARRRVCERFTLSRCAEAHGEFLRAALRTSDSRQ
jgi:glycosyltransferase involved in cell wall biosynthesis